MSALILIVIIIAAIYVGVPALVALGTTLSLIVAVIFRSNTDQPDCSEFHPD